VIFNGRVDRDAGAADRVDQRDQGVGVVKAEAAVADEADRAVESLEAAAGEPEPDRGEDAVAVGAERCVRAERLQS
jgi:hypothetical protein